MPSITLDIHSKNGALVPVLIGQPRTGEEPIAGLRSRLALVDTGAEHSSIDLQLASELGLKAIESTELVTPTEPVGMLRPVYEASITLEAPGMSSEVSRIQLTGAELSSQGFTVIVGRDILCRCVLMWDGPAGRLTLAI